MSSPDTAAIAPRERAKWVAVAGILGASAVILGALGAHGAVADHLIARGSGAIDNWRTAVLYHLVHSGILLAWALRPAWIRASYPSVLLSLGILGFCGSLYLLAAFGWKWLGPITPLGGLFLIFGWLGIAISGLRKPS